MDGNVGRRGYLGLKISDYLLIFTAVFALSTCEGCVSSNRYIDRRPEVQPVEYTGQKDSYVEEKGESDVKDMPKRKEYNPFEGYHIDKKNGWLIPRFLHPYQTIPSA